MKKNDWKNKFKKMTAGVMISCMLFTAFGIGKSMDKAIMPCGLMADEMDEL